MMALIYFREGKPPFPPGLLPICSYKNHFAESWRKVHYELKASQRGGSLKELIFVNLVGEFPQIMPHGLCRAAHFKAAVIQGLVNRKSMLLKIFLALQELKRDHLLTDKTWLGTVQKNFSDFS